MQRALLAAALAGSLAPLPAIARSDFQQWATVSVTVNASDTIRVQNELVDDHAVTGTIGLSL